MIGTVATFISQKTYGFITGEDGKSYYFNQQCLANPADVNEIADDLEVVFEPAATPKGYRANKVSFDKTDTVKTYFTPEQVMHSKSGEIKGWSVIQYSDWLIYSSTSESPEAAFTSLCESARAVNANAVLWMEYFKTKGQSGNYIYTIHNYKARAAFVAKQSKNGVKTASEFPDINSDATKLKARFEATNTKARQLNKRNKRRVLLAFIAFVATGWLSSHPAFYVLAFISLAYYFISYVIAGEDYDDSVGWWLLNFPMQTK
jgi:cold shock CspA family protein